MSNREQTKIICIGWHKTGTTTMGDALLTLKYTVVGAREDLVYPLMKNDTEAVMRVAEKFDALQDVPWAALYKELDQKFPGSKFILTLRDDHKWLQSAARHFGSQDIKMHEWLYGIGVLNGNEQLYLERYQRHNREVLEYFSDRPQDFLIMNLEGGDGWEKLCTFLSKDIPRKRFPHSNRGKHNQSFIGKIKRGLQNIVPMPLRRIRLKLLRALGVPDPRYRFNNREQNQMEQEKRSKKL